MIPLPHPIKSWPTRSKRTKLKGGRRATHSAGTEPQWHILPRKQFPATRTRPGDCRQSTDPERAKSKHPTGLLGIVTQLQPVTDNQTPEWVFSHSSHWQGLPLPERIEFFYIHSVSITHFSFESHSAQCCGLIINLHGIYLPIQVVSTGEHSCTFWGILLGQWNDWLPTMRQTPLNTRDIGVWWLVPCIDLAKL